MPAAVNVVGVHECWGACVVVIVANGQKSMSLHPRPMGGAVVGSAGISGKIWVLAGGVVLPGVTLYQPNTRLQPPPRSTSCPVNPHVGEKVPGVMCASLTGSMASPR